MVECRSQIAQSGEGKDHWMHFQMTNSKAVGWMYVYCQTCNKMDVLVPVSAKVRTGREKLVTRAVIMKQLLKMCCQLCQTLFCTGRYLLPKACEPWCSGQQLSQSAPEAREADQQHNLGLLTGIGYQASSRLIRPHTAAPNGLGKIIKVETHWM